MAHTDVDKVNGRVIRKLHSPDRSKNFGYICITYDLNGDVLLSEHFKTLIEARYHAGEYGEQKNYMPATPKTLPKSAHMHNAKGYRADLQGSRK